MKTLLQINSVISYGSTGRIADDIGLMAMENGWESIIAFGRMPRQSSSQLIRIGTNMDVIRHGAYTRLFDRHGLGSKNATIELVKKIEHINPNIIHLHNLHGYYLNILVLFKYLNHANIPVIWTLHDCWPFTGHCANFDFVGCNKWKTECFNCPEKRAYPESLFWDNSRYNYNIKKQLFKSVPNMILVPVSNWLEGLLKQSMISGYKSKVIHNGIDTRVFTPKDRTKIRIKYNLNGYFVVLGVASVWDRRKGLSDFLELSKIVNKGIKIILIGLNNKQIKSLPLNIIGIRRTENINELAEFYSMADLFVNPTWEDNFPTTNLEAMSCGTPVLTYRTGGSAESLTEDTGFIVEKGDIGSILKIIDKVMANEMPANSEKCRKHVMNNFNKNMCYLKYLQLFNKLIQCEDSGHNR
jgi:putative colanic acid biosynthesis glycosyltransferase